MVTPDLPRFLVLDTNVVLDWLVFRDVSTQPLEAALTAGRSLWLVTAAMRRELELVLTYPVLSAWEPDSGAVLATWDTLAQLREAPNLPLTTALRCTDPDDQKFIDLALHSGPCTLLSRDRAVLKLARRARPLGLTILSPDRWAP